MKKPILRAALWGLTLLAPICLAACYGPMNEPFEAEVPPEDGGQVVPDTRVFGDSNAEQDKDAEE